jgi:hypothetical protein
MATKAKAKRPSIPCPECGRAMTSNNLARHRRAAHDVEPEPSTNGHRSTAVTSSTYARSKAIGAYLALVDEQSDARRNGQRMKRGANLGRLAGFPNFTDDPDVIDAAADALAERARDTPSYIGALRQQQRAIELRQLADELRNGSESDEIEAAFVAVAAVWAAANGISYGAFRVMGVPAAVLREAGIS